VFAAATSRRPQHTTQQPSRAVLHTLTEQDTIRRYLQERGIDPDGVRKAIDRSCRD
jgi:hypothetical protein